MRNGSMCSSIVLQDSAPQTSCGSIGAMPKPFIAFRHDDNGSCGDGTLPLLAETLNPQVYDLARAQIYRRLLAESDACGCAGCDDVAGLQTHEAAQITDQKRDSEHHPAGGAVLIAAAVDL